jgi:hypothetical protein
MTVHLRRIERAMDVVALCNDGYGGPSRGDFLQPHSKHW